MSGMKSRFRDLYKKNALVSTDAAKYKRAQKKVEDRRVSRIEKFSKQRNLTGLVDDTETRSTACDPRKLRLQKWKEDKIQQNLLKKALEKPVFKCGVVHHKLGSPYFNTSTISHIKFDKKLSSTLVRPIQKIGAMKKNSLTDNTKESFALPNFKFKPPKIRREVITEGETRVNVSAANRSVTSRKNNENTIQVQENPLRRVTRAHARACNETLQCHSIGQNKANKQMHKSSQITRRRGITNIAPVIGNSNTAEPATPVNTESIKSSDTEAKVPAEEPVGPTNREVVEGSGTPEPHVEAEGKSYTPVQTECFPIHYSPFVTKGRGSSSRQSHLSRDASEQKLRDISVISCGREGVCSPTLSSNAVDTAEENRQHGITYFRSVLESETKRLEAMCQEWLQIQCSVPDLPPEASDLISAAVGQTQLLLTKKFLQFHGLINRCENVAELEATEPAVTCSDLDGFWDMMYMQVEDVDLRFSKLQELKLRNWVEEVEVKQPVARGSKKVKKVQKPTKSSLRAMITAARKRKQEVETSESMGGVRMNPACTPRQHAVTRNRSTPLPSQCSETSLVQIGQHSHRLSQESSSNIKKVTQMAKFSEDAAPPSSCKTPLPNLTPRKSILKSVMRILPVPVNTAVNNDHENIKDESIMKIEHSSVEAKENEVLKLRRSSRSLIRKVRFEGARDNSPKEVQPVTPYISHSQFFRDAIGPKQRDNQRISLLGRMDVDSPVMPLLPSGDLICFDSPISEPHRVIRRSVRLSTRNQN